MNTDYKISTYTTLPATLSTCSIIVYQVLNINIINHTRLLFVNYATRTYQLKFVVANRCTQRNSNNNNNKNNNKAFKSQTSWGRLELKPNRSNQGSGTWIAVFQAFLSKAKSLGIFYPFKSPFIASTQVNFGLSLPLFTLLSWLRIPLCTGASGGLCWTCPNHLNQCWTSFSSIGATPNLSRISSFRTSEKQGDIPRSPRRD